MYKCIKIKTYIVVISKTNIIDMKLKHYFKLKMQLAQILS